MVFGAFFIRSALIASTWSDVTAWFSASMASRYLSPSADGCNPAIAHISSSVRSRRSPRARPTVLHARTAVSFKARASVNGASTTTRIEVSAVAGP